MEVWAAAAAGGVAGVQQGSETEMEGVTVEES